MPKPKGKQVEENPPASSLEEKKPPAKKHRVSTRKSKSSTGEHTLVPKKKKPTELGFKDSSSNKDCSSNSRKHAAKPKKKATVPELGSNDSGELETHPLEHHHSKCTGGVQTMMCWNVHSLHAAPILSQCCMQ